MFTTQCRGVTFATSSEHEMPQNAAKTCGQMRSKDLEATHRAGEVASDLLFLSGRRDLNPRPLDPQECICLAATRVRAGFCR
jgi:hypothetical protein